MLAFVSNLFLFLASGGGASHGDGWFARYMAFHDAYLNVPGFEAWKFLNLGIFVAVLLYFVKKPVSEAFKAKRDSIRAELIRAEEEKKAAMARLTTAEAKLASLDNERQLVLNKAKQEADAEKARLTELADLEVSKLREQSSGEITRLSQVARVELKRFSAEESIRLAEEKLRGEIDDRADAGLVGSGIQAIGGLN